MIDITDVVSAVICLCFAIVTVRVIPWIKENVSKTNLEKAKMWAEIAVKCAEQKLKNGTLLKEERFEYVEKFLQAHGWKLNFSEIEALLESQVNDLPHMITVGHVDTIASPGKWTSEPVITKSDDTFHVAATTNDPSDK